MSSQHVMVLGTGLIGTSLGLALRDRGWNVEGWDPDRDRLEGAVARGGLTSALDEPITADADLVVIAAPPAATIDLLGDLSTEKLVTDVAGVKSPVVAAARHLPHFVGGHPMAGGASSGPAMASSHLFRGAPWVLVTDDAIEADLDTVRGVVSSIGAHPILMSADSHDRAVARVSHLPHLLAAALVEVASDDPDAMSLAGGGFRDLTRVAGADGSWWAELLSSNARHITNALADLDKLLRHWAHDLSRSAVVSMGDRLERTRQAREAIGEHQIQVRVILVDRPGELAQIGHALERSGVDVRDIQLRHAEHGGGGVLTISVRPDGVALLTAALEEEGFVIDRR